MADLLDLIKIDANSEIPIAEQLRQQLTWLIASGQLMPGDSLPSLRQLAGHLVINLHTVRSAYRKLEIAGLVETRQGMQTVILPLDVGQIAGTGSSLRTNTIGVILPSLENPFYHAFLQGIEERASQERAMLFVCSAHESVDVAGRYFAQLAAKKADGVILASLGGALPARSDRESSILPIISVDCPGCEGYSVLLDLEGAGYQAVRHLLEHGHRRIGLITFKQDAPNVKQINSGCEKALQESGIRLNPKLVAAVDGFLIEDGAQAASRLLSLEQPPTAIFAISDMLAIGAISTAKKKGLKIPRDIAVVGFNDIPLGRLIEPPLTTISAPIREVGWEAMDMLQSLIDGEKPRERQKLLPVSLVVRGSCGSH